jgi:23S rRNA pseudouridine1911/1915/1917 synthase
VRRLQERWPVTALTGEPAVVTADGHDGAASTGPARLAVALGIVALVVVVDQLTKWWAVDRLRTGPVHVVWRLDFAVSYNTGSAFSLFQGDTGILVVVAVALVAVLLVMVWRAPSMGRAAILGLILGGALGNLSDRFFRGQHGRVHPAGPLDPVRRAPDVSELRVTVPASLEGVRVDRAVALLADVSRSAVDALVAGGRVVVDGRVVASRSTSLHEGQSLVVDRPDDDGPEGPVADPSVDVVVVYEDDEVIVVDKPAGLVVHPGAGHPTGTLVHGLLARYPELADLPDAVGAEVDRPGIVHRLDRGTSGLMVVARTPAAYGSLVGQLSARGVSRTYRALVLGTVEGDSGLVDAPIGRSVSSPTRMAISRKGKEARTRYEVEGRYTAPAPTTLVRASLETGRTHQIRVHLAAIGHPVVGDDPYSQGRSLPGATVTRPFLHAYALAFDHPGTGERVSWTSELPEDLEAQLAALGE